MEFSEIFAAYYSQFRGQSTAIPSFGDREYTLGIQLGNSAIRTWDRVDGQLWRELIVTAQEQDNNTWDSSDRTVTGVTLTPPSNMRKPPAFVRFSDGNGYSDIETIPPQEVMNYNDLSSYVWFEGGANKGYVMHIGQKLATQLNGYSIDYVYVKKPTLLTVTPSPAAIVPDMSDPEFMIQKMVELRARPARNGFLYKTASADAKVALLNMKIENDSGVWGNADRMRELLATGQGWGTNSPIGDIQL